MKKLSITLAALALSTMVSACSSTHDDKAQMDANTQTSMNQQDMKHDHMKMMGENLFNNMDKNGDGVVSKKEYDMFTRKWFKAADTNHNGKLTMDEFKAEMMNCKDKMKTDNGM